MEFMCVWSEQCFGRLWTSCTLQFQLLNFRCVCLVVVDGWCWYLMREKYCWLIGRILSCARRAYNCKFGKHDGQVSTYIWDIWFCFSWQILTIDKQTGNFEVLFYVSFYGTWKWTIIPSRKMKHNCTRSPERAANKLKVETLDIWVVWK